jgi:TonB family protein
MRTRFAALLFLGIIAALSAGAAERKATGRAAMIYKPPIDYPIEARRRHLTGFGIVVVEINSKTGEVTRAYMFKSTGHLILDDAATSAFSKAKFSRGTVPRVKIPICYGCPPPQRR